MKSSEIFPESLVAFKIMPLEDMNEFTTHILEVVNAHMMLSKSNSQVSSFTLFVFFSSLEELLLCSSFDFLNILQIEPEDRHHSVLKNFLRELCHVTLFQMKHSYSSHNTCPLSWMAEAQTDFRCRLIVIGWALYFRIFSPYSEKNPN